MGQATIPPVINFAPFAEFYLRTRVYKNTIVMAYQKYNKVTNCTCKIQFLYSLYLNQISFEAPKSSSQCISLVPSNLTVLRSTTCIVGIVTSNFTFKWSCVFSGNYVPLFSVKSLPNVYENYIYTNMSINPNNTLHFKFPLNIRSIKCRCIATLRVINISDLILNFNLPQTVPLNITISPPAALNRTIRCLFDGYDPRFFQFFWYCEIHNRTIDFQKTYNFNAGKFNYIVESLNAENECFDIKYFYNEMKIECNCKALFLGSTDIVPSDTINFTIPTSSENILDDCVFQPHQIYNIYTKQPILLMCNFNYENLEENLQLNIDFADLNYSQRVSLYNNSAFLPYDIKNWHRLISGCKSFSYELLWFDSNQLIKQSEWTVFFKNQSSEEILQTTDVKHNRALIGNFSYSCKLKDSQGPLVSFSVYMVSPIWYIDNTHVENNMLFTHDSKIRDLTLILYCSIYSLQYFAEPRWCAIFKYGYAWANTSVNYFENLSITPPDLSAMTMPKEIYIDLKMNFPVFMNVSDFCSNPKLRLELTVAYDKNYPRLELFYKLIQNDFVDGVYQVFYYYTCELIKMKLAVIRTYVFYKVNIVVYTNPNFGIRGYTVKCQTNDNDRMFVFIWYCNVEGFVFEVTLKDYSIELDNKLRTVMDDFTVSKDNIQIIRFDYMLPPDEYNCSCRVRNFLDSPHNSTDVYIDVPIKVKDFDLDASTPVRFFRYMGSAMFLWYMSLVGVFLRLCLYQVGIYRDTIYLTKIELIAGFTRYSRIKKDNIYDFFHLPYLEPELYQKLEIVVLQFEHRKEMVERYRMTRIKSKVSYQPVYEKMISIEKFGIKEPSRNETNGVTKKSFVQYFQEHRKTIVRDVSDESDKPRVRKSVSQAPVPRMSKFMDKPSKEVLEKKRRNTLVNPRLTKENAVNLKKQRKNLKSAFSKKKEFQIISNQILIENHLSFESTLDTQELSNSEVVGVDEKQRENLKSSFSKKKEFQIISNKILIENHLSFESTLDTQELSNSDVVGVDEKQRENLKSTFSKKKEIISTPNYIESQLSLPFTLDVQDQTYSELVGMDEISFDDTILNKDKQDKYKRNKVNFENFENSLM